MPHKYNDKTIMGEGMKAPKNPSMKHKAKPTKKKKKMMKSGSAYK